MINFSFDYDEVVIISCSDIQFDSSVSIKGRGDVAVTNKRIVIQKKSILGKNKDTIVINKNDMKMFEGLPQIKLNDKSKPDRAIVDIYTLNSQYEVSFIGEKKKDAKPFVFEAYKAFGDAEAVENWNEKNRFFAIDGVEQLAKALKGTFDTVKDTIMPPEMTSSVCKSCGGQINGYVGRVAKCTFCGGQQKL